LRLLLDANLSPRGVTAKLRAAGHDVLALAEDATYEGLADPQVLELAASEQRILITRNSRDFAPLARQWAEAGRSHTGIILIWTLDHSQFAEIVARIERQLRQRPSHEQWHSITTAF
jgi:predicted nuclease of predicted toxin-antitoxin system